MTMLFHIKYNFKRAWGPFSPWIFGRGFEYFDTIELKLESIKLEEDTRVNYMFGTEWFLDTFQLQGSSTPSCVKTKV